MCRTLSLHMNNFFLVCVCVGGGLAVAMEMPDPNYIGCLESIKMFFGCRTISCGAAFLVAPWPYLQPIHNDEHSLYILACTAAFQAFYLIMFMETSGQPSSTRQTSDRTRIRQHLFLYDVYRDIPSAC